jgi:uncharacterized RDD family membrane protein YckC
MKSIEIKTTQNVLLEYELASLRDRILAFVLDLICIIIAISILSIIFFGVFGVYGVVETIAGFIMTGVFIFYTLAFEVFNNGQSLGKKALRIRVIKTNGEKATFYDYAGRWIFRMIDIYFSFGAIASMLIASSARGQRIGDIVSNTTVIKLVPSVTLYLDDILRIQSRENYQPVYVQVKHLAEKDVLLIKSTLDRYQKYDNDAHEEALDLLATRLKSILEIREAVPNNQKFLQTLINDYIVLTR